RPRRPRDPPSGACRKGPRSQQGLHSFHSAPSAADRSRGFRSRSTQSESSAHSSQSAPPAPPAPVKWISPPRQPPPHLHPGAQNPVPSLKVVSCEVSSFCTEPTNCTSSRACSKPNTVFAVEDRVFLGFNALDRPRPRTIILLHSTKIGVCCWAWRGLSHGYGIVSPSSRRLSCLGVPRCLFQSPERRGIQPESTEGWRVQFPCAASSVQALNAPTSKAARRRS